LNKEIKDKLQKEQKCLNILKFLDTLIETDKPATITKEESDMLIESNNKAIRRDKK